MSDVNGRLADSASGVAAPFRAVACACRIPAKAPGCNDTCSFHRLFVDPLSRAMYSSKGPDFEFLEAKRKEGWHIHDSVYALAQHNWAEEMAELEAWADQHDRAV